MLKLVYELIEFSGDNGGVRHELKMSTFWFAFNMDSQVQPRIHCNATGKEGVGHMLSLCGTVITLLHLWQQNKTKYS